MSNNKSKILLINETFIIDHKVHNEWLEWFRESYLSAIKMSNLTADIILSKIGDYNPDGVTYAMQFKIRNKDMFEFQNEEKLIKLRNILNSKFSNKFASFVTVLEIVES